MGKRCQWFALGACTLLLFPDKAFGQVLEPSAPTSSLTVRGRTETTTGEALPYTHLSIPRRGIGTASNSRGEFIFTVPAAYQHDTVKVSFVGYEPAWFVFSATNPSHLLIKLKEAPTRLPEVTVRPIAPLDLIKQAIARIPDNYAHQPHRMRGFYRLSSKKYEDFIHISEAVFDLYSADNDKHDRQFKLLKSRTVKDLTPFHGIENVVFGLKPAGIFSYDLVRTIEDSDILSGKHMKKYVFQFNGEVNYDGVQAYEIVFDQKEGLKEALYAGKCYIDTRTFAFLSFTYWLSPKGISYWKVKDLGQRALMSLLDIHERVKKDSVRIEYRPWGNKYFLHRVSNNSVIAIRSGRYQFDFPAVSRVDYLITELDTSEVKPFPSEDLLNKNKYIEDQSSEESDRFWEHYNVIAADYDYAKVAQSIRVRNKTFDYRREIEALLRKCPKDKAARIDTVLSFYARKGLFNGTALVKYRGEILFSKGYGWANQALRVANHSRTRFRIGSMAKSFTSALILRLVEAGKLQLDDPVKKFVPDYAHPNITVRQLLTHQSGIPNYTNNAHYLSSILTARYSIPQIVKQFCSDSLEFEPGTQFSYSNSGYVLLAAIIEKVTQISFGEALDQMIFKPLGMQHTFFGTPHNDILAATGYQYGQPELPYPIENTAGAGGIASTVEDLARWDEALYPDQLLTKSKVEELFEPNAEYRDWGAYYGLGWMIDRYLFRASKKHRIVYHPGTDFGFYSVLMRQPDAGHAIILLSNTGDFPRFEMADLLLDNLN